VDSIGFLKLSIDELEDEGVDDEFDDEVYD